LGNIRYLKNFGAEVKFKYDPSTGSVDILEIKTEGKTFRPIEEKGA